MRRIALVIAALCSTMALLASGPAAEAATAGVVIDNFKFTPSAVKAPQGATVKWSQEDSGFHTTTSNQLFWDSGNLAPGATFSIPADYAGTFAYYCTIHDFMTGTVGVKIVAAGTQADGFVIRWSRLTTTPVNRNFDVQIKRPGQGFTSFRSATTTRQAAFNTNVVGEYRFRARTRNLSNATTSDWSPVVILTVTS